jgi:4-hydroxy-4-methyl-2-oxoglutarate aldolase
MNGLPPDNGLGTSALSDALDRLGLGGQTMGLRPAGSSTRIWGPAFTVRMAPAAQPPGSVGDYIDDVPPGAVVVIDNAGRLDATVWGDILTTTAGLRGVGGTVINGVCRDSWVLTEQEYPLFSLGVHMHTGKDRVQMEATGEPVSLGGTRVEPGDLVVGDRDGVLIIAAGEAARVVATAQEIEGVEDAIRAAVRAGRSLREARAQHGYHALQSRAGSGAAP